MNPMSEIKPEGPITIFSMLWNM